MARENPLNVVLKIREFSLRCTLARRAAASALTWAGVFRAELGRTLLLRTGPLAVLLLLLNIQDINVSKQPRTYKPFTVYTKK